MAFFPWARLWRSRRVGFSLTLLGLLVALAVFAPWLAPHDPYRQHITDANLAPFWASNGQLAYPLGTDRFGRDVLSRLLYGARTAFGLALTAVPLAAGVGTLVGLLAGVAGGRLAAALTYVTDVLQALPGVMIMVMVILLCRSWLPPTWESGLLTLILGFASVSWASLARLIRVQVQQLLTQPFIEAARALGASRWHILLHHLLPNVWHLTLVWLVNHLSVVILLEAVLGYIGVGITNAMDGDEFTVVSWGGLFYVGRSALNRNPFILAFPALGVLLLTLSFFWLGEVLQELTRPAEG